MKNDFRFEVLILKVIETFFDKKMMSDLIMFYEAMSDLVDTL